MTPKLRSLASLVLPLALVACQSSPNAGASTGKSMGKTGELIENAVTQMDATLAALNDLAQNPAPDLADQYKEFDRSLTRLTKTADQLTATAASMDTKGQEYFMGWETQLAAIQNKDIRDSSAERKKDMEKQFKKLQGSYLELRQGLDPLLADLGDVRIALKTDLTMGGVKALDSTVKKVNKQGSSVTKQMREVAQSFSSLASSMGISGPPQPAES